MAAWTLGSIGGLVATASFFEGSPRQHDNQQSESSAALDSACPVRAAYTGRGRTVLSGRCRRGCKEHNPLSCMAPAQRMQAGRSLSEDGSSLITRKIMSVSQAGTTGASRPSSRQTVAHQADIRAISTRRLQSVIRPKDTPVQPHRTRQHQRWSSFHPCLQSTQADTESPELCMYSKEMFSSQGLSTSATVPEGWVAMHETAAEQGPTAAAGRRTGPQQTQLLVTGGYSAGCGLAAWAAEAQGAGPKSQGLAAMREQQPVVPPGSRGHRVRAAA